MIIKLFNLILKVFEINNNKIVKNNNSKIDKIVKILFKSEKSKNIKSKILIYLLNNKTIGKPIFLIFNIKKAFNYLK